MAAPGSEQQRFKAETDMANNLRSLEQELIALQRERNNIAKDREGIERGTLERLKDEKNKIIALTEKQLALEKQALMMTKTSIMEIEEDRKKTAEALLKVIERELSLNQSEISIAEKALANTKANFDLQKQIFSEEQRKLEKVQDYLGKIGEIFKLQTKNYKLLKDTGLESVKWLVTLSSIAAVLEFTLSKFFEFDTATTKLRISFGILRADATRIELNIRNLASSMAAVGVTFESAAVAAAALADEFGGIMKVTPDLLEATALMSAQLGVSEVESAGFLRNMGAIAKTTAQAQIKMEYFTSALSSAAGVPLNLVMQDVAKMTGNALALISRMPMQIVKTAVAAREMGTTLNRMADSSAHLLNFTQNVQEEMEASVLLGRSINLQKARELAYHRNIEGSTREILKIAKEIDFEHLDFFQMQAFAAATGRSAEELFRMVQAQRQLDEARRDPALKGQVAEYDRLKGLREGELNDAAKQRELAVKQMANQERVNALTQQWNALLLQATETFFPMISGVFQLVTALLKFGPILSPVVTLLSKMGVGFQTIETVISRVGFLIFNASKGVGMIAGLGQKLVFFAAKLASFGAFFAKFSFLGPFLKVIPVIGWVILAFQTISSAIKHITAVFKGEEGIWEAMGNIIYDVLLAPFKGIYNWVVKHLGFGSPSEMIWSVIKGIIAGQAYIFDAFTSPFRRGLAWILEKIPFLGKGIAEKLRGGMTGVLQDTGLLDKKALEPITTPQVSTTPVTTPIAPVTAPISIAPTIEQKKQQDADSGVLSDILKAVSMLNANLLAGKIAVNLDGQLVSTTLARQTAWVGGYGTNTVHVG